MRPHAIAGLLAMALGLGACEEGPSGPDDSDSVGTFEATITGGFSASMSGEAVSGASQGGGYVILMQDPSVNGLLGQIGLFRAGARPAAGSYTVSGDQTSTAAFLGIAVTGQTTTQNGLTFNANSGAVTITESTATRVRGTFALSGIGSRAARPDSTFSVGVTGEFDAIDQDP